MRRLLTKSLDQGTYVAPLRNLLPVYTTPDEEVVRHQGGAVVGPCHHPGLSRVTALEADLEHLSGSDWRSIPVLPEATAYVGLIREASNQDPALLVAHAYVRYLGDLSGGQILKRIVAESYGLT